MWCQGSRHLAIVVKTNRQVIFGGLSICPVCRVGVALATGLLSMSKSAVPTWTVNRFKSKHSRIARRCSSAPGSRWRVSATLHIGSRGTSSKDLGPCTEALLADFPLFSPWRRSIRSFLVRFRKSHAPGVRHWPEPCSWCFLARRADYLSSWAVTLRPFCVAALRPRCGPMMVATLWGTWAEAGRRPGST